MSLDPITVTPDEVLRFLKTEFALRVANNYESLRRIERAIACFERSKEMELPGRQQQILRERLVASAFWLIEVTENFESGESGARRHKSWGEHIRGRMAVRNNDRMQRIAVLLGTTQQQLQADYTRYHS